MASPLGFVAAQMDEHEAYTNLSESLRMAEAACRQLAFMRRDHPQGALWMVMAGQMGKARANVSALMQSSAVKLGGMVRQ
jgi:hypothetical protein